MEHYQIPFCTWSTTAVLWYPCSLFADWRLTNQNIMLPLLPTDWWHRFLTFKRLNWTDIKLLHGDLYYRFMRQFPTYVDWKWSCFSHLTTVQIEIILKASAAANYFEYASTVLRISIGMLDSISLHIMAYRPVCRRREPSMRTDVPAWETRKTL